ncbi:hypothetical protein D3C73_1378880 [compost metagenome]
MQIGQEPVSALFLKVIVISTCNNTPGLGEVTVRLPLNVHNLNPVKGVRATATGIVYLYKGITAGITGNHNLVGNRTVITQDGVQHYGTVLAMPVINREHMPGIHWQCRRCRKVDCPG